MMTGSLPPVLIFDLDGTLYESEAAYSRYAQELSRSVPFSQRAAFLRAWDDAKRGRGPVRVGLVYDATSDQLWNVSGAQGRIPVEWTQRGSWREGTVETRESPADGLARIGDWWGLLDVLAVHHGVSAAQRSSAFAATRTFLDSDACDLLPEPGLLALLQALHRAGKEVIAMSNSPAPSVSNVLRRLGFANAFDAIIGSAGKPEGLRCFLESSGQAALSIGDHFVNDIEPALRLGHQALYIDRHATLLGEEFSTCYRVSSIQEARAWLDHRLR